MEQKDKGKKQILLRISPKLWEDLAAWAEDDFRSINGQIVIRSFIVIRA